MERHLVFSTLMLSAFVETAPAQFPDRQHSGSIFILTTPEGANSPTSALENHFPVLVRLHEDFLEFSQTKANAEDIRFSASNGMPSAFQSEEFHLDGARDTIASGSVSGNVVRLKLAASSTAQRINYLDRKAWNQTNLLACTNGIAALTLCKVPISPK